ncbi:MAG: hypothetical protein COV66_07535 [Nitrospinae bacterium CG11_big_fil_rev_8_21_14_0_20_45_15]|nr:MAG: hypothetical protein COV66_07535 [Nitrospinae bacterium CG11_big_fil_rev_8_21_14_0_20_45_15]
MTNMMKIIQTGILLALYCCVLATPASAFEFRSFTSISKPMKVPEGATRPDKLEPLDPQIIKQAVYDLAKAWNGQGFSELIDPDFANAEQLLLVITNDVPRNARLEVLSVQSLSTLDQFIKKVEDGEDRTSTVTATVRMQIVFNDPVNGFQRLEGTNELLFRIEEEFR